MITYACHIETDSLETLVSALEQEYEKNKKLLAAQSTAAKAGAATAGGKKDTKAPAGEKTPAGDKAATGATTDAPAAGAPAAGATTAAPATEAAKPAAGAPGIDDVKRSLTRLKDEENAQNPSDKEAGATIVRGVLSKFGVQASKNLDPKHYAECIKISDETHANLVMTKKAKELAQQQAATAAPSTAEDPI